MRIVYLHQYFITPDMPGGTRSYEMARRLVARGHEVHMITSDQSASPGAPCWRESTEAGIHVHWTPVPYHNKMSYARRILAFLHFAWRAGHKAAALRGDVIFATSTPLTIALPAVYAAKRSQRPMVFEVRDLWPAVPIAMGIIRNPLAKMASRWLERFAYRNSSRIVALTPGMRDEVVMTGYPSERVRVIPNGCDLDLFGDAELAKQLRGRHEWLGERPLLVYAGSFGAVNGIEYLVELAAHIARLDPEIRIVGVGGGRELDRARQMAAQAGILDRQLFLLGLQPKRVAAAWVQAADVTIALIAGVEILWKHSVQNKFFDSLAAGKPVLNNLPGWQAQIAEEAGAGLILGERPSIEVAEKVVRVMRDRAWLERAGQAAHQLATGCFNRDQLGAALADVLEDAWASNQKIADGTRQ